MNISQKFKAINHKVKQNKAQYNLDRQTATISALSSGNVNKYEFLTAKDVLSGKVLLEKTVEIKRFKYSSLGKNEKHKLVLENNSIKSCYKKLSKSKDLNIHH